MNDIERCEYCNRLIKNEKVTKVIKGNKHIFCSEFCFRLQFYNVPTITHQDLNKMYAFYCVSIPGKEYRQTIKKLAGEEG